jgi:hypothetical protein
MLRKPDTPRNVLLRRERSRRSKKRGREGRRCWSLEISDEAMEGLIAQAVYLGKLTDAEAADNHAVARVLARLLEERCLYDGVLTLQPNLQVLRHVLRLS